MAKSNGVWGIDIGQSALKALRCRPHEEDPNRLVADAFDFIEYPQILSEPDADSATLIKEALEQFLSRNSLRGDRVVISVSGQAGLARFIKLPPVESKKIPDIVKYEAKQQIPFDLDEVVWDYQQMGGGAVEEGFALETEVGLFAMKRDQVVKVLEPFNKVDVEVDVVQLTPLALYNYAVFDQMHDLPPPEEYDPDNPPASVVVLSLGTDTTDLVVTNGYRVWQRSIPVGGNHFTKALVKDMKMSFATAEHLKRNAAKAEDPKALFQAMRPVFNDLLTEVQRSIGYFSNMDRAARIERIVALGNVMRLPGLQKFLAQNLGFDVERVEKFKRLSGPSVVDAPAFKENLPAFGVCYGLCLQGARQAQLNTNLLPPEITQQRVIRAKKPWVMAAAALLLLGCTISYAGYWNAYNKTNEFFVGSDALKRADNTVRQAGTYQEEFNTALAEFDKTKEVGESFLQNVQGRQLWIEFMKAVNLCLPRNPAPEDPANPKPKEEVEQREELKITTFDCYRVDDLTTWYSDVHTLATTEGKGVMMAVDAEDPGPEGPGWIIEMGGHHFRNWKTDRENQGMQYLRNTLLKNLSAARVEIPENLRELHGGATSFPVGELGIKYPVLIERGPIDWNFRQPVEDPTAEPVGGRPAMKEITLPRYNFVVQFVWQEIRPGSRETLASAPAGEAEPTEEEVTGGQ